MLSWFGRRFVVLALVLVTGGHWALLQTVAWVGMAVSYSQESTLREALVKTFDGQHPCQLCKVVRHGEKAAQNKDAPKPMTKLDLFAGSAHSTLLPLPRFLFETNRSPLIAARRDSPPTPPPKSHLG